MEKKLAERQGKTTLMDMVVEVEVDTIRDKVSMIRTEALMDTLAYTFENVDMQALCYTLGEVDPEILIYALFDRLPVDEKKVGNMSVKVERKGVLDTLAARETEVKVHTLGDTLVRAKGNRMLNTLSDTVADKEVESLATHRS